MLHWPHPTPHNPGLSAADPHRKERYLVLRTDWVVEYYISQEVYDAGGKPKGCMHLEGYTVVRDPNGRKVEAKKALRQQFGIEGDVTYSKYEPLVLECFHPVSRRWLIRLSNQAEFDAWAHMLEQATLRARSRVLTDPIAADAFRITFERLREPLVVPSEKVRM